MKKILTLLIALLVIPLSYGATRVQIGDLYYYLYTSTLTAEVTSDQIYYEPKYENLSGALSIPEMVVYEGTKYSVTEIGSIAFRGCIGLTSVEIPNSVTKIGNYAFEKCSGFTGSLTIPESVTEIGERAFYGCNGLTSVEIGNSVTEIGNYAFSGCNGLTGELVIPNSVTSIGDGAFYGCSGLTSVVIGKSVGDIGDEAFRECPMLKEVYALPIAPPLAATNKLFDSQIFSSATLYVADKSLERYKTISPWSYFLNIVGKDFENGEKPAPTQIRILPVLFPGESMKLCAIAEQDSAFESLSWSSSDSSIISVNGDGVAKALGLGTASISATTENGISAVLEILVIEDYVNASVDLNIVNEYSKQNVYTLDGILLIENAIPEEIRLLNPGIYIIGGKKVVVK